MVQKVLLIILLGVDLRPDVVGDGLGDSEFGIWCLTQLLFCPLWYMVVEVVDDSNSCFDRLLFQSIVMVDHVFVLMKIPLYEFVFPQKKYSEP